MNASRRFRNLLPRLKQALSYVGECIWTGPAEIGGYLL